MKITKYAQSTVEICEGSKKLLIDPGKYNFEPGRVDRNYFKDVSVLVITHKHADHYDLDAVKNIAARDKPVIYTVQEIKEMLANEGIAASVLSVGDTVKNDPFIITAAPTNHLYEGQKVDCFGVIVEVAGKRIYHTSDTLYLEEKPKSDVLFVPINNRGVSMSIDEAVRFSKEISPRIVVPVHYDSPKDKHINPQDFANKMLESGIETKVLDFGQSFSY